MQGPIVRRSFSIGASIAFVRASLGIGRGVMFDRINIDCDSTLIVGDIPDVGNQVFTVTGETVAVHCLLPAHPEPLDITIPYFAQVIDLKREIAARSTLDVFRLELLLDDEILDDASFISTLAFSKDLQISVQLQSERINRLYFEKDEDTRLIRDFKLAEFSTFADVARSFHTREEFIMTFEVNGNPLKLSTPLESHLGHPQMPISLVYRESSLRVVFHEGSTLSEESIPVRPDTLTGKVKTIASAKIDFKKKTSRYLILNSRIIPDADVPVLQINPDLDPIFLREATLLPRDSPEVFLFRYRDSTLRLALGAGATVDAARRKVAQELLFDPKLIEFFLDGRALGPANALSKDCEYSIFVESDKRSYQVVLSPVGCPDSQCRLQRAITVDASKQWAEDTLLRHFLGDSRCAFESPRLVPPSGELSPQFSLSKFAAGTTFRIQYQGPTAESATYSFLGTGQSSSRKMRIRRGIQVLDVKFQILRDVLNRPTVLPRVLRLSFWECELQDDFPLIDYGIPEGSRILWSETETIPVTVISENGDSTEYQCSQLDQIADLKQFLGSTREIALADFELKVDSTSDRIADIGSKPVRLSTIKEDSISLNTSTGRMAIKLRQNATLADAKTQIATLQGIRVEEIRFRDGRKIVTDEMRAVTSLPNLSIDFAIPRLIKYGDTEITHRLFGDTFISDLRKLLEASIGKPCPRSAFAIRDPDGVYTDDDMTLDDVGDCPFFVLEPAVSFGRKASI
jgi:hypothetical protein